MINNIKYAGNIILYYVYSCNNIVVYYSQQSKCELIKKNTYNTSQHYIKFLWIFRVNTQVSSTIVYCITSTYTFTRICVCNTRHETTTEIVNRLVNSFRFPSVHTLTHRFEVQLIRSRSDAHHTDDACILIITLYTIMCEVQCRYGPTDGLVSGGVRRSRVSTPPTWTHTHTSARPALTRKISLYYIPCTCVFHNKQYNIWVV